MNLYLTLAFRYLGGRKLRTALTTLAIVFGVMVIFGMNTFMPTFIKTFQTQAMAAAAQVDLTITQKTGEAFDPDVLEKIRAVDGIEVATGALERLINLPADYLDKDPQTPDRITAVMLKGIIPQEARQMIAYNIVEGRFLEDGDTSAAVITRSLAREFGVEVGDTLTLPTAIGLSDLTIVGILPEQILPGNEVVLVPLAEAQRLTNMADKINVVDANLDSMEEARRNEIQQNVLAAIGDTYKIGALEAGSEILTNIRNAQSIFNLMGFLALVMGGFIIFNTFRTIIAERRRDIGMLRALGANRSTIRWLILTEGLLQGIIGTALGLVFGYLFGAFALGLTTPLWQQYLNMNVSNPEISPALVLTSIVLGVGITILSGLIPAQSATRITPLEALRPSMGTVTFKRVAGISFWAGVVLLTVAVGILFTGSISLISLGAMLFVGAIILMAPALVNPIAVLFANLLTLILPVMVQRIWRKAT
mgnify:CR=1 FL=1